MAVILCILSSKSFLLGKFHIFDREESWKLERGPGLKMLTHMPVIIWVSQIGSQGKNLGAGGLCGQGSPEAGKSDEGSETEKEKKTIQEVLTTRCLCE